MGVAEFIRSPGGVGAVRSLAKFEVFHILVHLQVAVLTLKPGILLLHDLHCVIRRCHDYRVVEGCRSTACDLSLLVLEQHQRFVIVSTQVTVDSVIQVEVAVVMCRWNFFA